MNAISLFELEIIKLELKDFYYILESNNKSISEYLSSKFQKGEDRHIFLESYKVIGSQILFFLRWVDC